jgi:hypothetical protein
MRLLRRSSYLLLALVMAVSMSGCLHLGGNSTGGNNGGCNNGGCNNDGGPCDRGNSGGTPGIVTFQLNVINPITRTGSPYQIQVTWTANLDHADPVGSGTTDPQSITKPYSGNVGEPGAPDPHGYQVSYAAFPQLHPGTWTFTVTTDLENWTTNCQQNLPAASLNVNFTHNIAGCMTGTQFP